MSAERATIEQRTWDLAGPIIAGEGLELIEVEYLREREGWILRLFIDKPSGGVGLEDCQKASRAVETALDVEDFIPQEYHLEVSSPGLSRPLRKPQHFERVLGQQIKVKTFGPLFEPPRKNFTGKLSHVTPDGVTVEVEGAGPFTIAFKDIAKANLEYSHTGADKR
jgi:ribosome maturation factor RimP